MIRVAIIGAGIGREHLAGYRALPGQFQVRWICDLDTARAYTILGGDTGPEVTTDIDAVMRDPETDLIDICLPPHLHVPIAMEALAAGKHVICEKPIAPSLADCDALAEEEARAPGRVFPVFQYRYGPGTAALDALIAAGLAGAPQVASLETHWNRGRSITRCLGGGHGRGNVAARFWAMRSTITICSAGILGLSRPSQPKPQHG
ncbi:Gfo/Idh/MocA family oxidoreductase [Fontisubflavum oceani]|uniref:Gfo/Idh/MocA family protein n=1 Tax=Fontisubflavum oceani TaxID=2978973 RepID=UPI0025B2CCAE|nr:Gfo/Idh/MocA family oxidoreductase [Fontisubflavum oceani]WJY20707.1 Gfo/Idh/MocA family oxidoreductase [Fontisubflavum oceani]